MAEPEADTGAVEQVRGGGAATKPDNNIYINIYIYMGQRHILRWRQRPELRPIYTHTCRQPIHPPIHHTYINTVRHTD